MRTESLVRPSGSLIYTYYADVDEELVPSVRKRVSSSLRAAWKKAVEKVFTESSDISVSTLTSLCPRGIKVEVFLCSDVYDRNIGKLVTDQQTKELMALGKEIQSEYCREEVLS